MIKTNARHLVSRNKREGPYSDRERAKIRSRSAGRMEKSQRRMKRFLVNIGLEISTVMLRLERIGIAP